MYFITVLVIHSVLCITLIGLVLLQQGKGADAGATFGGGSSNSVFGAAGATDFITRLTTSLAVGFMVTSILLIRAYSTDGGALLSTEPREITEGSIMEDMLVESEIPVEEAVEEDGIDVEAVDESGAVSDDTAEEGTADPAAVPVEEASDEAGASEEESDEVVPEEEAALDDVSKEATETEESKPES